MLVVFSPVIIESVHIRGCQRGFDKPALPQRDLKWRMGTGAPFTIGDRIEDYGGAAVAIFEVEDSIAATTTLAKAVPTVPRHQTRQQAQAARARQNRGPHKRRCR
jgi:hypothetical protein